MGGAMGIFPQHFSPQIGRNSIPHPPAISPLSYNSYQPGRMKINMCFLWDVKPANHIFLSCCWCSISGQRNTLGGYLPSIEQRLKCWPTLLWSQTSCCWLNNYTWMTFCWECLKLIVNTRLKSWTHLLDSRVSHRCNFGTKARSTHAYNFGSDYM